MTNVDRWMLPAGVEELLPDKAAVAESLRRQILDLFATWGYELVIPPLIEFTDSLLIGMGRDVETQSFRLTDQLSGKPMAVRADITPQVARIDAHSLHRDAVSRLCYAGSVLHARPRTQLESRCPIQIGAELYGDASVAADIEVISLMLDMLEQVGATFDRLTLDLGHAAIFRHVSAVLEHANPGAGSDVHSELFETIQRKSGSELQAQVAALGVDATIADALLALPSLYGDKAMLDSARSKLAVFGDAVQHAIDELVDIAAVITERYPSVNIYFDLAEARGYEYHTGVVFAAYASGYGLALANGGRYDDIGQVFGRARPATGFNTDIKALIDRMLAEGTTTMPEAAQASAIAAPLDTDVALWQAISELRRKGNRVVQVSEQEAGAYTRKLVNAKGKWLVE